MFVESSIMRRKPPAPGPDPVPVTFVATGAGWARDGTVTNRPAIVKMRGMLSFILKVRS